MKPFFVAMVMTLTVNSGFTFEFISEEKSSAERAADASWPTAVWTTPGTSEANLNGKMVTLSSGGGRIRFFPTNFFSSTPNPWSTPAPSETPTTPHPTTRYPTTPAPSETPTTPYPTTPAPITPAPTTPAPTTPYWTTAPSYRGVSVCLRYLSDSQSISLFTLSPSTKPLEMGVDYRYGYSLSYGYYPSKTYLRPDVRYWSDTDGDIWTRVCLTVDRERNVAQVFSGFSMSIRKILSEKYVWSGEPVIDIPGFDGQVTDLQVWDYPLRYKEVFSYMTRGVYVPYQGNVLTWSSIGFSLSGKTLLEDVYEKRGSEAISSRRGRGQRRRAEKKAWTFTGTREKSERDKQRLR